MACLSQCVFTVKTALSVGVFVSFSPLSSESIMGYGWAKKQSGLLHVHLPSLLYTHPNINAQTSFPPSLGSPPATSRPASPPVSSRDPKELYDSKIIATSKCYFCPNQPDIWVGSVIQGFNFLEHTTSITRVRKYFHDTSSLEVGQVTFSFHWENRSSSHRRLKKTPACALKGCCCFFLNSLRRPEAW